ncbi:MAG: sugar phosphate isomerase/epimerase [Lentisphaeria bacterium]|nr:sugar phosphate isomerase/epimerase [Lentisphaeria bacterium]
MYDLVKNLGVKTFSFRSIPANTDVAAAVKQCGVCVADLSGCHVNYNAPENWPETLAAYRDAGVLISGIGVVTVSPDDAHNRPFFEFARLAGCGVVSVTFDPEGHETTLARVEALAEEYGVRAAIHNHGGYHWLGNSTILRYLFKHTSPRIGLCLDTAWCMQSGEDPVKWLEEFGGRLYGIHFKDFTFTPGGKAEDTVVGEGALDLPNVLARFRGLDFTGSAVVEYEGADPVAASAASVANILR